MYTLYGLRIPVPTYSPPDCPPPNTLTSRTGSPRRACAVHLHTSTVSTFPGRVCDHRKLLERGFLLRTASIYHLNNIQVALDMCCARILRARALFCVLGTRLTVLDKFRAVTDTVVVSWCDDEASPRGAFGTTKSFPRSVFCFGQLVSIIYTGYPPRRSC